MKEDELTTEEWMKRLTKRLVDSPTREEQVAMYLKSGKVYDCDKGCYVYEYE